MHVPPEFGRCPLPHPVYAVQRRVQVCPAIQTARLVHHNPPADLSSGLYDVDVFESRDSLHEAKGGENRILERNYRITGNIEGKQIIIVDDVLTSGQSMADYKEEIERCGGKVVAAIFYGKPLPGRLCF